MNDLRRRFYVAGIAVLLLFGVLFSQYVASERARQSASDRAESVLIDSAREQAKTLASTLNGRFEVLESLAASLALHSEESPAAVEQQLNALLSDADLRFSSIALLFPDGSKATGDSDYDINVADRAYFQTALSGVPAIEHVTGKGSGKPCVILAVPYIREGRVCGVLRGLYYEEDLRALLTSQAYGGGSYSYLIDRQGNIIINAENEGEVLTEANLLDALSRAAFHDGDSLEALKLDLLSGQSATLHYDYEGISRVAVVMPFESELLPENDWLIFNTVYEDRLSGEIETSRRDSIEAMSVFAAFAAAALVLLLLLEFDLRRRQARETELVRQREEQFRIITEQSEKFLMRYDIPMKTFLVDKDKAESDGFGGALAGESTVAGILRRGLVVPASEEDYRAFFRRIEAGESPIVSDIQMVRPDGEQRWYKHVSATVFDRNGRPRTAVISYYDDTEQREREVAYAKWQQELEGVSGDNTALYEWNLTRDIHEGQSGQLAASYSGDAAVSFNARTAYFLENRVSEEDRPAFAAMMNREHLLAMYYSKTYRCSMDYRYIEDDGSVRWRQTAVQLVPYPDNSDIKAYVTTSDIDEKKRGELALIARSERDFLTDVLNRETFVGRVRELIGRAPAAAHALLMLDVDGFKQVNDRLGHDAGDRVLRELADTIRATLRVSDIVGRIGGDEFMVFLPEMPFDAAIGKKAGQLCAALHRQLNEQLTISVSIGIAVFSRDGVEFDDLYRCADTALYYAKGTGKNNYAFYQKGMSGGTSLTGIDPAPLKSSALPAGRAVFVATDSEDTFSLLSSLLAPDYGVLRLGETGAPTAPPESGSAVYAAILDMDTSTGRAVLRAAGRRLAANGVTLFALLSDGSEEASLRLINAGVVFPFQKPVNENLLRLRLDRLYTRRAAEAVKLQSAYRRLQTGDELRYREVLNATGTTVFVYDTATRTYQASLLSDQATAASFSGHSLSGELLQKGILGMEDAKKLRAAVDDVGSGKAPRRSELVRLTTKTGEQRYFRIQVMPMENGDALTSKLLITANDVNEQVLANEALRFRAERDALTGLYNREAFFERAAAMILAHEAGYYVMACFDIDSFKVINDQYGTKKGDRVLKYIADIFREGFEKIGGICCRVMADNFAVLYPADFMDAEETAAVRHAASILDGAIQPIAFSIGRYIVDDLSLSVSAMYDRAALAEASIKGRFDKGIALYDESMREHLLREQEIRSEMDAALTQGQFETWFQPQYNHGSGALIGAEALVRWRHPRRGLVPPDSFIPVFERSGFIYELDKYVWAQACAFLRQTLDAGRAPLPVSVNVSRYDIFRQDFFEVITGLVERYTLPVGLLHIEITESAFAKSAKQIIAVVEKLSQYGFTIEIDDFGSGYSSLNTLKDVPADVLKLDMRFLESEGNTGRGGNILESIVRMARWLGMAVIAEGVETRAQADYLKSIGCSYVQGYLYGRAMPADAYAELMADSGKEPRIDALETVAALDNNVFWDPASMETLIFNSYVGGACIFEYHNGKVEMLRVNEKYVQALGGDGMTAETALSLRLDELMDPENGRLLSDNILSAIETGGESTCEVQLCRPSDGAPLFLRSTVRVIARAGDRLLFYGSVADVSAQRAAEQKYRETSEQMRAIMDSVNGGVSAATLTDGVLSYIFVNDGYYAMFGFTREQFEKEAPHGILDLIHKDDRPAVLDAAASSARTGQPYRIQYRAFTRDKRLIYVRSNGAASRIDGFDMPVQIAVSNDVTGEIEAERQLLESSEELRFLNAVSNDLLATGDPDEAINDILTKVLQYFKGNRAYVFELDEKNGLTSNTYEVCAAGIRSERARLQNIPIETIGLWCRAFERANHIRIEDVGALGEDRAVERQVLESQGIRSLVAVPLRRDGRFLGFMGVDDPVGPQAHVDHLEALGDYMAVVLTRRDLNAKIQSDSEMLRRLINDMPGGFSRLCVRPDGRVALLYVNEGFCRLVGMTADEITRQYGDDAITDVHPDDVPHVRAELSCLIESGDCRTMEYRLRRGDGDYVRLKVTGRVSRDEAGTVFLNLYYTELPAAGGETPSPA